MRTRTFLLSFFVHACMICAAMAVRIFANTELPDPPRSTSFMMAAAEVPEVVPPPAPRRHATASAVKQAVTQSVAPIEAADSIAAVPSSDIPDVAPSHAGVPVGLGEFAGGLDIGPPPPAPRRAPPPPPLHVGGVVRPPQKIHHVPPTYPAIAQAAKVTGTVILEALIAEDGSVREVKILKSVPLLDAPALDAVRQWRFTPTLLNGVPVQVIMSVTVTFTLR